MGLENYNEAVGIITKNPSKGYFAGPRSEALIRLAEQTLGFQFFGTYRHFLANYGAGNFGAQEIYGVISDDFENSSVPDAIWYTITERKEIGLPLNLLVIYDTGNGEIFCLDFKQVNKENEPTVVSFVPGVDLEKQTYEKIADDFGDFLLDLVNQEIDWN